MEKYNEILLTIYNSYINNDFDLNKYEFYKCRPNKNKYRAGIISYGNEKYFFKIILKKEYNDESKINDFINPLFATVEKYAEKRVKDDIILLYKYVDAVKINAYNYLRNKEILFSEKEMKVNNFFNNLLSFQKKYFYKDLNKNNKKSDRWFFERYKNGNLKKYYGENCNWLLSDISYLLDDDIKEKYNKFFYDTNRYLENSETTIFTFSHGDFHDFNFTFDGLYWDIDTFGNNPILNDFIIYYWHFYAREDYIIERYSPWLTEYMNNSLNDNNLTKIRQLKKDQIIKWYEFIENLFNENKLDFKQELVFKLFCRVFLIDNVLKYSENLRKKIYMYFYEFIISDNISTSLFNNYVEFK